MLLLSVVCNAATSSASAVLSNLKENVYKQAGPGDELFTIPILITHQRAFTLCGISSHATLLMEHKEHLRCVRYEFD